MFFGSMKHLLQILRSNPILYYKKNNGKIDALRESYDKATHKTRRLHTYYFE